MVAVGVQVPLQCGRGLDPALHGSSQEALLGRGGLQGAAAEAVRSLAVVLAQKLQLGLDKRAEGVAAVVGLPEVAPCAGLGTEEEVGDSVLRVVAEFQVGPQAGDEAQLAGGEGGPHG
jgi:hypothetical protein